jgi:thiopeptide-type bacteriocin biosynthesis protein
MGVDLKYSVVRDFPIIVRVPLLPLEEAFRAYRAGSLTSAIGAVIDDSRILAALYVASPTLYESLLSRFKRGETPPERSLQKALRYLIRMSARPTPFGLFAAVSSLPIDSTCTAILDSEEAHSHTRVDMAVVEQMVTEIERDHSGRNDLKLYMTDYYKRRGDFLVVFRNSPTNASLQYQIFKTTGLIKIVAAAAANGISVKELVQILTDELSIDDATANVAIDKLLDAGFLVSDVRSLFVRFDDKDILRRWAAYDSGRAPFVADLYNRLAAVNGARVSEQSASDYGELQSLLSSRFDARHGVFQTHSTVPISGTMSENVIHDAARLATLILYSRGTCSLSDTVNRLISRYEGEFLVPLMDLEGDVALEDLKVQSQAGHSYTTDGNRKMFHLLATAAAEGHNLVLSRQELLALLEPCEDNELPKEFEFAFHIVAKSKEAINRGEYLIVASPFLGSFGIGKSVGRLLHLLPEHHRRLKTRISDHDDGNTVPAEIIFVPNRPRTGNVCLSRSILNHEIQVGVHEYSEGVQRLPLQDLYVGVHDKRLFLWSSSLGRKVQPLRHDSLAAVGCGSDIINLLVMLPVDGLRNFTGGFALGDAENLAYNPRVTVDRLVLSPARWKVTSEDARDSSALKRWVHKNRVPRLLWLWTEGSQGDQRLLIDIESEIGLAEVCSALASVDKRAVKAGILEEAIGVEDSWLLDKNGAPYFAELIAPLALQRRNVNSQNGSLESYALRAERHLAGADGWLYFKLYCDEHLEDVLLRSLVLELVNDVKQTYHPSTWFFLRYSDQRSHLRIRFQLADPEEYAKCAESLWRRLSSAMKRGLVSDVVQAAYHRELERYGGPAGMEAGEAVFTADSDAALECLSANVSRPAIVAAAIEQAYYIVSDMLDGSLRCWLSESYKRPKQKLSAEQWETVRAIKQRINKAAYRDERLRAAIAAAKERVATDHKLVFLRSVIHMHFNRYGISGNSESEAMSILWQICSGLEALSQGIERSGHRDASTAGAV